MNYLEDRRIDRNDVKSGWILLAIVKLGFVVMTL